MELDYGVGRIMEALKKHKIEEDTFLFFSSDNGAATYAHEDGKYSLLKKTLILQKEIEFYFQLFILAYIFRMVKLKI